jgi:hypothetical protein
VEALHFHNFGEDGPAAFSNLRVLEKAGQLQAYPISRRTFGLTHNRTYVFLRGFNIYRINCEQKKWRLRKK